MLYLFDFFPSVMIAWLDVLREASLKGIVILAAAGVCGLLWRHASAAIRHLMWSVALTAVLALPALSLLLPSWHVPLLPDAGSLRGACSPIPL